MGVSTSIVQAQASNKEICMALKPCKECGKDISTEAKACPNCGKKDPTGVRTSPVALGCLGLLAIGLVTSLIGNIAGNSSQSVVNNAAPLSNSPPPSVSAAPTPTPVGSQWHYASESDEMTGKAEHTASVTSDNTVEFAFPYQGAQHGYLTLRKHPRFGNNVLFSIQRGQLLCHSYDNCTILVRFDDGEPSNFTATGPADHSTETLFIENYARFASRLRGPTRVRISPRVYQQGSVVFTFDVSGFNPKKLRSE